MSYLPLIQPPSSARPPVLRGGALKDVLQALTPTLHRDAIASPLLEAVAQPLRESLQRYPYAMSESLSSLLQGMGINCTNFGHLPHPHPAHKTIETHLLFDSWTFQAKLPSTVMFMKPEKFDKLQRGNQMFDELINFRLTPKDTTRYPDTALKLPSHETVFMHDALMYFTPEQILDLFGRCPRLQKIYASLVVPAESDFCSLSLFPELYRFHLTEDTLTYTLEKNPAHNYQQPRAAIEWLKTTTIKGPDETLTISRLDSWGPVHSLLIQRGVPPIHSENDELEFAAPECIELPNPASLSTPLRDRLVPKAVYDAIFVYVRAVRTLRVTDPAGFVRTQCSKPEFAWVTSAAWDNLQHFALVTASHRPSTKHFLFHSRLQRLKAYIRTNALQLAAYATAPVCLMVASASLAVIKATQRTIVELRLFGFELVSTPSIARSARVIALEVWSHLPQWFLPSCRPSRLPRFQLQTIPRVADVPFRGLCQHIARRYPGLASWIPREGLTSKHFLISAALASLPAITPESHTTMVGPPSAVGGNRPDPQPSLPTAPQVVESGAPYVDLPFQWESVTIDGSADLNDTLDLSSSKALAVHTNPYRHAELLDVEVEICPLAASFEKPVTLKIVWTPANLKPASKEETWYYGGKLLTIGGPVLMGTIVTIPANLNALNRRVKASIPFNDCPRLSLTAYKCGGTAGTNLAQLLVRGHVRCSGPTGAKNS